jgi:hypothetical protein
LDENAAGFIEKTVVCRWITQLRRKKGDRNFLWIRGKAKYFSKNPMGSFSRAFLNNFSLNENPISALKSSALTSLNCPSSNKNKAENFYIKFAILNILFFHKKFSFFHTFYSIVEQRCYLK